MNTKETPAANDPMMMAVEYSGIEKAIPDLLTMRLRFGNTE